jgi:hypothetical protein
MSKISERVLCEAVKNSKSWRGVCSKLGLKISGNTYKKLQASSIAYAIDTSHFLGMGINKGSVSPNRKDASRFFSSKTVKSHILKISLIRDGYKEAKCEICKLEEWLGKDIPIELDHIDGDNKNNKLENLRILCPNCHAMQPTNSGKNKKLKRLQKQNGHVGS